MNDVEQRIIDISYKELSPEITAIYGRRFLQILNEGGTFGFFLSPDMNALNNKI